MKKIITILLVIAAAAITMRAEVYNVRDFGAKGDGVNIDSPAINAAIAKAAANGGGTVFIPAGRYASYSIRLASHINLHFEQGATLIAAKPTETAGFDAPEPGPEPQYQDYGHSHWKNSLIWGIGLEDITISGHGYIDGVNLSGGYGDKAVATGVANKTIALKECKRIVLKDFSVYHGGHFVLLATGVENMIIDGVSVDTARDGFDIDCCRNVRVSNCLVNSPYDDAIVLKASYGLGRFFDTEDVVITNCNISGYACGSVFDCTYKEVKGINPHTGHPLMHRSGGRIKLGTESSGGFKNVAVTNCSFSYSGGLFLESMDGGHLEDVVISNCTMRHCIDSPIFFRLGSRMRSPEGTPIGTIKRVLISDINSYNAMPVYGMQITGIPGHPVQDVTLRNIHLNFEGGKTPGEAIKSLPENEKKYPDPWIFGARNDSDAGPAKVMPMKGMILRHVDGITLDGVHFSFNKADSRPLCHIEDVNGAIYRDITLDRKAITIK